MTSVAAEQFHREYDPVVHYGPVWSKSRESGDSFAACTNDEWHGTLTTHLPWVTCPKCKALLSREGSSESSGDKP